MFNTQGFSFRPQSVQARQINPRIIPSQGHNFPQSQSAQPFSPFHCSLSATSNGKGVWCVSEQAHPSAEHHPHHQHCSIPGTESSTAMPPSPTSPMHIAPAQIGTGAEPTDSSATNKAAYIFYQSALILVGTGRFSAATDLTTNSLRKAPRLCLRNRPLYFRRSVLKNS